MRLNKRIAFWGLLLILGSSLCVSVPCHAEATCEDMMARLKTGENLPSNQWWDCLDQSTKEQVIVATINLLKGKDGVTIKSPASYYVKEIDAFRSEEPRLKGAKIRYLLSVTAAMSYDYDEGIPKEETLKKFLMAGDADKIIEIRKKENTSEGVMPKKMLSGNDIKASLMEMIVKAGGFTNNQ